MFRKELFDKYVPIDDYIRFHFTLEDWPTWLILSKYTKVGFIPISTATYRFGHSSISNPLDYEKIEKRFLSEQKMYIYLCNLFPNDLEYNHKNYVSYIKGILLNHAYVISDFRGSRKYAKELIELGNSSLKVILAQFWITFKLFSFTKRIRHIFNEYIL